jgi:uncharacterized membrane protein YcfT
MARTVIAAVVGLDDVMGSWLGDQLCMFLVKFTLDFLVVYVSIVIVVEVVEKFFDLFIGEVLDVLGGANGMVCYNGFAMPMGCSHCRAG